MIGNDRGLRFTMPRYALLFAAINFIFIFGLCRDPIPPACRVTAVTPNDSDDTSLCRIRRQRSQRFDF